MKSEVGRGSTFWIELPVADAQPVPAPGAAADVPGGPSLERAVSQGTTVLYIEDNLSNLRVMQMLLEGQRPGWCFVSARNGRLGLEQARQIQPEVILLDLQLPGMLGEEVLGQLRSDPRRGIFP